MLKRSRPPVQAQAPKVKTFDWIDGTGQPIQWPDLSKPKLSWLQRLRVKLSYRR